MENAAKVRINFGRFSGLVGWAKLESQGDKGIKIRVYPPKTTIGVRNLSTSKTFAKPENIIILRDDYGIFNDMPDIKRELEKDFDLTSFM